MTVLQYNKKQRVYKYINNENKQKYSYTEPVQNPERTAKATGELIVCFNFWHLKCTSVP